MKPTNITIGFTGNRPNHEPGRRIDDLEKQRPKLRTILNQLILEAKTNQQTIHFVCSLAEGADQIACQEALSLQLPVQIVLPCSQEQFTNDFERPSEALNTYLSLLQSIKSSSSHLPIIELPAIDGKPDYQGANNHISTQCQYLIAMTNGRQTGLRAGASEFIKQAQTAGKKVIEINTLKNFSN